MTATNQSIAKRTGLTKISGSLTNMFGSWGGGPKSILPQQLKEWVVASSLANNEKFALNFPQMGHDFTAWLNKLPPEELASFTQKVADFCISLNFELNWLVDPKVKVDEQLKLALKETVILYSLAHWRVAQAQDNIKAFAIFHNWQKNPTTKEHKILSQLLFGELVAQKVIPQPPPTLFLAPEDERENYIIKAINQTAEENIANVIKIIQKSEETSLK